jgi:cytochrome c oxidase subunit 4
VLVGASLLFLTWLTVRVSYMDFGIFNLLVGVGIASIKATLVVMFFMHLKYDEPFNKVIFLGCLAFLAVFFVLTLADTMERGKVDPLEAHEIVPVPARPELNAHGEGQGAEGHAAPAAGETPEAAAPAGEAGAAHPGDGVPAHDTEGGGTQDEAPPPGDAGGH